MAAFVRFGFGNEGELGLRFTQLVWEDLVAAVKEGTFKVDEKDGSVWIPLPRISAARTKALESIEGSPEPDSPPCPPFVEVSL